jgi:hypothetical protein
VASGCAVRPVAPHYLLRLSDHHGSAIVARLNRNVAQGHVATRGIDEDVPTKAIAKQVQPIAIVIDDFLKHGARPLIAVRSSRKRFEASRFLRSGSSRPGAIPKTPLKSPVRNG